MESNEVLEFRTALLDEVSLNSEVNNEFKHTSFVNVFSDEFIDNVFQCKVADFLQMAHRWNIKRIVIRLVTALQSNPLDVNHT